MGSGETVLRAVPSSAPETVTVDYATADEGIQRPLSEAADELVDPLPDVGEPVGLHRADSGLLRQRT